MTTPGVPPTPQHFTPPDVLTTHEALNPLAIGVGWSGRSSLGGVVVVGAVVGAGVVVVVVVVVVAVVVDVTSEVGGVIVVDVPGAETPGTHAAASNAVADASSNKPVARRRVGVSFMIGLLRVDGRWATSGCLLIGRRRPKRHCVVSNRSAVASVTVIGCP